MTNRIRRPPPLPGMAAALALALVWVPLAGAAGPAAGSPAARGVDAAAAFAALKRLEGVWSGTADGGKPVTVEYRVMVGGTTVVETQSPAAADEMVTVYSIANADLVLTHYCPMGKHGNQPRMRLDRRTSTPTDLRFVFSGGSNLDAAKDMHVHGGRLVLVAADRLEREWEINSRGQKVGTERFVLSRQAATAAQRR